MASSSEGSSSATPLVSLVRMTRCDLCNETHQSHLPTLRQLYEEAFPRSERRPWSDLEQLIGEQGAYHFFLLEHPELGVVGFVTLWHFDDFYYGEHFAILPQLRNHRLGEQTLHTVKKYIGREPLYFEVEPETLSEIAGRRINYYERNGFQVVKRDYLQPPYHHDEQGVPLYIMSSEQGERDFIERVCKTLVDRVYPHF